LKGSINLWRFEGKSLSVKSEKKQRAGEECFCALTYPGSSKIRKEFSLGKKKIYQSREGKIPCDCFLILTETGEATGSRGRKGERKGLVN